MSTEVKSAAGSSLDEKQDLEVAPPLRIDGQYNLPPSPLPTALATKIHSFLLILLHFFL